MVETSEAEHSDDGVGGLAGAVLADRYRIVAVVSAGANTIIADAVDVEANQPVTANEL